MQALIDAGLEKGSDAYEKLDKTRAGVLIGSGMGGLTVFQDGVKNLVEKGYKKITPFFIPYAITNMCVLPSFPVIACCLVTPPAHNWHLMHTKLCKLASCKPDEKGDDLVPPSAARPVDSKPAKQAQHISLHRIMKCCMRCTGL